jgi:hypothetical protein
MIRNVKNIHFGILILFLSACSSLSSLKEKDGKTKTDVLPDYVAISPISLPPIAADMKAGILEIANGVQDAKLLPYDMDLLVLPTTLSKVQYKFFKIDSNASGIGVTSGSASSDMSKAVYDLMHMASHPLTVVLKPLKETDDARTIIVTPFIGVGVRVVAEYKLSGATGGLSLPALAAQIESKKGTGSIEIQQLGISRYGLSNQGVTGIELTPNNIEAALKSIGYMMGQIWLSDTRVQPMIVGYSVPGYTDINAAYHPYIVNQLISRKAEIMQPFIESMFYEAQEAYGISGVLKAKSGDNTDYNAKKLTLRNALEKDRVIANTYTEFALEEPERLPELFPSLFETIITDRNDSPLVAKEQVLKLLDSRKAKQK